MLNTQRFYIRPLAYLIMNSLAFNPLMTSIAVAEENEGNLDLLNGLSDGTSQVQKFMDESNLSLNRRAECLFKH